MCFVAGCCRPSEDTWLRRALCRRARLSAKGLHGGVEMSSNNENRHQTCKRLRLHANRQNGLSTGAIVFMSFILHHNQKGTSQMNELKILDMKSNRDKITEIITQAEKLQALCSEFNFNAFQPGAIKELKMATILNHNWIRSKAQADACTDDGESLYEYLSATENGNGQIDRFFKDGPGEQHEKYLQSMQRITRNAAFFLAYTNKDPSKPLDILRIYRVPTSAIEKEANRQLAASKNNISHLVTNSQCCS